MYCPFLSTAYWGRIASGLVICKGTIMKKEKEKQKKFELNKIKRGIVDFSKLLWTCITYKMVLLVIAVIYVVYAFSGFRGSVQKQINKNTKSHLSLMVSESLERIHIKMNDEFIVLNTMALFYDGEEEIDLDTTRNMLEDVIGTHNFVGVRILDSSLNEIISLGKNKTCETSEFYNNALEGNNAISPIIVDEEEEIEYINLAVPVYNNGKKIIGILSCNYEIDAFTKILDTSSFEQLGTTLISQEDGILVSRPESVGKNTNLFVLLDSININNEKSIKKLKKSITNGQSGIITYGTGKHKRYICYDVVPDTNWYSVSIVSANAIEPVAKKVSSLAMNFAYKLSVIFVIYILITLIIDISMARKEMKEDKARKKQD